MGKHADSDELHRLRRIRERKTLCRYGRLVLTETEMRKVRENYCSGCGGEKRHPKIYFGETFCGDCVEKWQNGKR